MEGKGKGFQELFFLTFLCYVVRLWVYSKLLQISKNVSIYLLKNVHMQVELNS